METQRDHVNHAIQTWIFHLSIEWQSIMIYLFWKFESITVGIALALRINPDIVPNSIEFLNSKEFKDYTNSNASSSKNKVINRIYYVRDQLLGNSWEVHYLKILINALKK